MRDASGGANTPARRRRFVRLSAVDVACLVFVPFFLAFVLQTDLGRYLKSRLDAAFLFQVRHHVFQIEPEIADELKVFAIDDSTLTDLDTWYLNAEQWTKLLRSLALTKPRMILIDSLLQKVDDPYGHLQSAIEQVISEGVPIVVGAYLAESPRRNVTIYDFERQAHRLSSYLSEGDTSPLPNLPGRSNAFVYGPAAEIAKTDVLVGHISTSGGGRLAPLVKLDQGHVLREFSLWVAGDVHFKEGAIVVDGKPLPQDGEGFAWINFAASSSYAARTYSLGPLLAKAEASEPLRSLKEGDTIFIQIHGFTGNTDFLWTPIGYMPGGRLLHASMSNVLRGDFLKPLRHEWLALFAAALVGVLIGRFASLSFFWVWMLACLALNVGASALLFAKFSYFVPWLFTATSLTLSGVIQNGKRVRDRERHTQRLRIALDGAVSKERMRELLDQEASVSFAARERFVTVMFIDVVGFSKLAEDMLPHVAFRELKELLTILSEQVHDFGGVVDKSLGDGLLCYFGHSFVDGADSGSHAESAVRCALAIQEKSMSRSLEAETMSRNIYPLRIGINSASCYLGDLGSRRKAEFTVVGNGVNFAKRLEGACEMFSVLVAATTYEAVKELPLPVRTAKQRLIRIKHHTELVPAFEFDPFADEALLRQRVEKAFRKCAKLERRDRRFSVPNGVRLDIHTEFGIGCLVNFSYSGFSLLLKRPLSKGTRLTMMLDSRAGLLRQALERERIGLLVGEVRFSHEVGEDFVHGIYLESLTEEQGAALVSLLCEFAFAPLGTKETETDHAAS